MEGKASPKREFKQSKNRNQKALRSNLLEAIAKANNGGGTTVVTHHINEDGVLRVKIVVRKQDLKQMLGRINGDDSKINTNYPSPPSPSLSVEQQLNLLRKKHAMKAGNAVKKSFHRWSPQLQSIPEE
ncbi:hypothetical protein ES319_D01G194600v1 [Gossypium barbadense]|uniref:Uncharacterized protein n=2 Tax=Gossypium TaxID=3633 RepID=A0A5J5SQF6_GOSBA|nr:hypothetical protein ES319_D01G194600v1 [Gossypium barbadense]PPD89625.1 hypothetical protein GOBAR_DD13439 [Gossypium barbadense]TYG83944.1 hypothetical protein ES288_D01G209400v1 [Gossypium darwinii]